MAAILFALDGDDSLATALTERGHRAVGRADGREDLVPAVLADRPSVVVVTATRHRLTRALLSLCDDLGIRVIAIAASERGRRHAVSLGLHEVVDSDVEADRLDAMISAGEHPGASSRPRGTVLVVWGPAGAPGRTTIAISIAAELVAAGYPTALVDADTHAASIAPALGLLDEAPGFAAACRLAAHGVLSLTELDRIHQAYRVGKRELRVLTGITRASRWPELGSDRVSATLELCRDWADYTVVDVAASLEHDEEISSDLFAPRRNAATLAALRAADRVIGVCAADPIGIARYLRALDDLTEIIEAKPVTTVANRVRATVSGLGPAAQVRSTLARFGGIDDVAVVPNDPRAADAALSSARIIADAAPRSQALSAIRSIVSAGILPRTEGARTRRSMRLRAAATAAG